MTARARRCRAAPVTLHFSSQEAPGQLPPTKDEPRKNTASHDRDFFFCHLVIHLLLPQTCTYRLSCVHDLCISFALKVKVFSLFPLKFLASNSYIPAQNRVWIATALPAAVTPGPLEGGTATPWHLRNWCQRPPPPSLIPFVQKIQGSWMRSIVWSLGPSSPSL